MIFFRNTNFSFYGIKIFIFILLCTFYSQTKATYIHNDSLRIPANAYIKNISKSIPHTVIWNNILKYRMDSLLSDKIFQRIQIGMLIYDLTTDSMLFRHGEKMQMRPASVMKTLTSTTALEELGGAFQYTTSLYTKGKIKKHQLQGDLYIVGGYDPRFGADDMLAFIQALTEKGINKICGNIYTDISLKDTLPKGSGWCWDDPDTKQIPLLYNAEDCFMLKFFQYLDNAGITHPSNYSIALLDSSAKQIISRTHSIDQILMRMLKESDNTYAESLFFQLAAHAHNPKPYAEAKESVKHIFNFIKNKLKLDTKYYTIVDGSGLSLYNYLTPELIVMMLRYAYHRPNIYLHLYPALPVAGFDGTLNKRMKEGSAHLNIHAKTGSETGVSSIAGYCTAGNNHTIAFAIFNQGQIHLSEATLWQDKVLQALTHP